MIGRLLGEETPRFRADVRRFAARWPLFATALGVAFALLGGTEEGVTVALATILVGIACYPVAWVRFSWVPVAPIPFTQRLKVIGLAMAWGFGVLSAFVALMLAIG